jgi:toxin ParE1/3/4
MPQVTYSKRARLDLMGIARYTTDHWGLVQTRTYINILASACEELAKHPNLARNFAARPGIRRFEVASHVVFFRVQRDGILVARILHKSMHAPKHLH